MLFVFNKFEVAEIFANNERKKQNADFIQSILGDSEFSVNVANLYNNLTQGNKNKIFIQSVLDKTFDPAQHNEEFMDKLGILGMHTFYHLCRSFPDNYDYDDDFGIKISFEDGNILLSPEEVKKVQKGLGTNIFPVYERLYGDKISQHVPRDCKGPRSD
jgi:hypothetical protein